MATWPISFVFLNMYAVQLGSTTYGVSDTYLLGDRGSDSCPPGWTITTTSSEVTNAASALNLVWHAANMNAYKPGHPKGGFENVGKAFFNTVETGEANGVSRPICKRSTASIADVKGDPITYYGGVRQEFWLPLGELTLIMRMPDLQIYASTFKGHGEEQWMNRIVIRSPQNETVVDVRIRPNILDFKRDDRKAGLLFETLEVHMDWAFSGPPAPMIERPPADGLFVHWRGIQVIFGPIRNPHDMPRDVQYGAPLIGDAQREVVGVYGVYGWVYIMSESAAEYYGYASELAVRYAHLDLMFLNLREEHRFTGILPELWGLQPLSCEVQRLKKPLEGECVND